MTETIDIKMARMEEKMKSVERQLDGIATKLDDVSRSIESFHEKSEAKYATKSNLVSSGTIVAILTAAFTYLVNYYFNHR